MRERFLSPEKPRSAFAKKLIGGKSFAGNDDVQRYRLTWGGWWIDYDEKRAKKQGNQLPPKKIFEQEKLIICQNALRLRAAYDTRHYYCKDTFFVAYLKDAAKQNFDLKFFLALLNSKLLHYLVGYLNSLPIVKPTEHQQREIVALVEKIMATKDNEKFKEIDDELDHSIYQLYGLTSQEGKIVDASTDHFSKN